MAMNVCLAIIVYFILPETKQIPLEEMDTLFGGVNHVEKGAAIMYDVEATVADDGAHRGSVPLHEINETTQDNDKRV